MRHLRCLSILDECCVSIDSLSLSQCWLNNDRSSSRLSSSDESFELCSGVLVELLFSELFVELVFIDSIIELVFIDSIIELFRLFIIRLLQAFVWPVVSWLNDVLVNEWSLFVLFDSLDEKSKLLVLIGVESSTTMFDTGLHRSAVR